MPKQSKEVKKYYWDANIFIHILEGKEDIVPTLLTLLDEGANKRLDIYTSLISMVEVAFAKQEKDKKQLEAGVVEKIDKLWLPNSPIKIIELSPIIAARARDLIREAVGKGWGLKPADAIHLASAENIQAHEFHTDDKRLYKFGDGLGFTAKVPEANGMIVFPQPKD